MTKNIDNPTHLDALVVAPHPDDAELGMGGGILKMLAQGLKVGVLDLTSGEPTPHGLVRNSRSRNEGCDGCFAA